MPREKRYESIVVSSFYIPSEQKALLDEATDLARTEGISRSELIVRALSEYVKEHGGGNPQTKILAFDPRPSMSNKISLSFKRKALKGALERWKKVQEEGKFNISRQDALRALQEQIPNAAKVYDRSLDQSLKSMIDEAMEILKKEGMI